MIILDTNVISEAMKPNPAPNVRRWLNDQEAETLYITSITIAELLFGIGALPNGKRQQQLTTACDGLICLFKKRVLHFDENAARHYATLAVIAKKAGKGFPTPDGYIAAIAASNEYIVATRDVSPFLAADITTINPWES